MAQEQFLHSPILEPFDDSSSGEEVYEGKMLNDPNGKVKENMKVFRTLNSMNVANECPKSALQVY